LDKALSWIHEGDYLPASEGSPSCNRYSQTPWRLTAYVASAAQTDLVRRRLFSHLKTKGFAWRPSTSPTCTLLALLAFAVAFTVKTGVAMARLH
jgi:hypothetical protein